MKHLAFAAALAPAVLGFSTTIALSAGETQPFSSPKANEQFVHESKNLQAFVKVNKKRGTWCAVQATLRLYIRDDSVFGGEQKELNKFLDEIPGVLRSQCNKIRGLSLKAFIGTKPVYVAGISGIGGKPKLNGRITNQKIIAKYQPAVAPTPPSTTGPGQDPQPNRRTRRGPQQQPPTTTGPAPQQPPAKLEGQLFATAQTVGQQCDVLAEWISRFRQEYPALKVSQYSAAETEAKAANLFSDAHFVPVFGRPYDGTSAALRNQIFTEIYRKCPRSQRNTQAIQAVFRGAFAQLPGIINAQTLRAKMKERREVRAWLQEQNDQLDSIPSSATGFDRLNGLATTGAARISGLWPSEQTAFNSRVSVRKSQVALSVANDRISKLPQEGESLSELKSIVASAEPHVIGADRQKFAALTGLADGRRQEIRVALVERELAALPAYPNTIRSLKQILDRQKWLVKIVGKSPPLPVFDRFEQSRASRSDEIARAALPAYRADLNQFSATLSGALKALADFAAISDLLETTAPAHKAAYQQVAVRRADRIYDDLIAAAVANVRSTNGGWRDAVRLVATAKGEVSKFRLTRASQRAAQITAAARGRAESLAKKDLASFRREVSATAGTWAGLATLDRMAAIVGKNRSAIPALQKYTPAAVARRGEILDTLAGDARGDIQKTGGTYLDVANIVAVGERYARAFDEAKALQHAASLRQTAAARAATVVDEYLPVFKSELTGQDATRENAGDLKSLAEILGAQSTQFSNFKLYQQAALTRSAEMLGTICDGAVKRAGLSSADKKESVLGADQGMTLREFVCGLDEQGHQVREIASPGSLAVDGGYTMRVFQSNGEFVHVRLRKIEALPGQDLLVGFAYGDANRQDDISVIQWRQTVASLLGKAPLNFMGQSAGRLTAKDLTNLLDAVTVFLVTNPSRSGFGSGTGFFVAPDLIMTNQHVVEGPTDRIHIFSKQIGWREARYVAGSGMQGSQGLDVAIIKIEDYQSPLYLQFSKGFSPAEDLTIAGFPGVANDRDKGYRDLKDFLARRLAGQNVPYRKGLAPTVKYSFGKLQAAYQHTNNYEIIQHGVQTARGNSGSAVVNACGEVIGIHTMATVNDEQAYNLAYSVNEILLFLNRQQVVHEVVEKDCAG